VAVEAVHEGSTIRAAAKQFGVARIAVQSHQEKCAATDVQYGLYSQQKRKES
jgi:hypothetical protein